MNVLSDLILHTLRAYHRGKARAVTRADLLSYLRSLGHDICDRDLREMVKDLSDETGRPAGVCMCNRGYYLAEEKIESDEAIAYLRKKIFPLWKDIENIIRAYPEFYPDGKQMELF